MNITKKEISKLTKLLIVFTIAILCSCSHEKNGELVKDSKGNYYLLDGYRAIGSDRYLLRKIDTSAFKPNRF